MKNVRAYVIKDTRLRLHIYEGGESQTETKESYILTDRKEKPKPGQTVRTLFSIDDKSHHSGGSFKIPNSIIGTSVEEIDIEKFLQAFEYTGGTVERKGMMIPTKEK